MSKVHPGFTLSQLIETTATELRAVREKNVSDPIIQLTGCELELAVTVSAEGSAGIKFWVVDASTKAAGSTVSKIKLTFNPVGGAVAAVAQTETKTGELPKRAKPIKDEDV